MLLNPTSSFNVSFPTYLGATYDASTTNLTYSIPAPPSYAKNAESLEIILSFLSPITPTSTLRQSLPASYLTVHVKGNFDVDIYIDLNGQWVSGDRGSRVVWDLHETKIANNDKGLKIWKVRRESEQMLTEYQDRAEWGTLYFAAPSVSSEQVQQVIRSNDLYRTYAMRLGHLHCCVKHSPGQAPCRTKWMTSIAA